MILMYEKLITVLNDKKNEDKKVQFEKYFKNVLTFYGIPSPELKEIFKKIYNENIKSLEIDDKTELAKKLMSSKYAEEKYFAIMILNKNIKLLKENFIDEIEYLIKNYVYDWSCCDSISTRVVKFLIVKYPSIIDKIKKWSTNEYLWLQRSSAVSFVLLGKTGKYNSEIIEICSNVVKNKERFAQLGNGWVLRELSLADLKLTIDFIETNYNYFSREGLRYAIEKMDIDTRNKLLYFKR